MTPTTTRRAAAGPLSPRRTDSSPRQTTSLPFGILVRMPYWVFTGALALIFVYPLVWTGVSSVSPKAGTSQVDGWGLGN